MLNNATLAAYEDLPTNGRITAGRDVDAGAVLSYTLTGAAPTGFQLQSDGSFSMLADDPIYQNLSQGQVRTFTVGYRVTDEHGAAANATMTINVTGRNDAPSLTGAAYAVPTAYQGQGFVLTQQQLLLGWTDADGPMRLADRPTVDHATVTVQSNGSFLVTVDAGYTGPLLINYGITDGYDVRWTSLTTAATDAARIGGTTSGSVTEDRNGSAGTPTTQGLLTITDVGGDESFRAVSDPQLSAGGYGRFILTASGSWNYTLDNGHAAVAALNTGQLLTDSFTVYAQDGTAQTITVTVNGATDWTTAAPFTGIGDQSDYDSVMGAFGTDRSNSTVTGTAAGEVFTGGSLAQTFDMLGGNDTVYGRGGDDVILGGDGFDYLYGQAGSDQLDGGLANDSLFGGSGADRLLGGDGSDTLRGGSGADTLEGGAGMDFLTGGFGADTLTGGADRDIFIFDDLRDTGDTITDFQMGVDTLDFSRLDANTAVSGDQALQFGRNGPAANSLWTVQNGSNVDIFIDTDGDARTAEFSLTLLGVTYTPHPDFLPGGWIF